MSAAQKAKISRALRGRRRRFSGAHRLSDEQKRANILRRSRENAHLTSGEKMYRTAVATRLTLHGKTGVRIKVVGGYVTGGTQAGQKGGGWIYDSLGHRKRKRRR